MNMDGTSLLTRACEETLRIATAIQTKGYPWGDALAWGVLNWRHAIEAPWMTGIRPASEPAARADDAAWAAKHPWMFAPYTPDERSMRVARSHPDEWMIAWLRLTPQPDKRHLPRPTLWGLDSSLAIILGADTASAVCSAILHDRWDAREAVAPDGRHVPIPDTVWRGIRILGLESAPLPAA